MSNSKNSWIVSNPDIHNGKRCIKGTKITIVSILIAQNIVLMITTLAHFLIH